MKDANGYIRKHQPGHPNANKDGYVLQHRLVASKMLGRPLERGEHVHHRDEQRDNNIPENLEVLSARHHLRLHYAWTLENGQWFKPCGACKRRLAVTVENFGKRTKHPDDFKSDCRACARKKRTPVPFAVRFGHIKEAAATSSVPNGNNNSNAVGVSNNE